MTLKTDISAGFDIGRIESPSHDIVIEKRGQGRVTLRLAGHARPSDRDFILGWALKDAKAPQAGFFYEKVGDEGYGLLMVMPPVSGGRGLALGPRPARDMIFVIDTSGSMHDDSIAQAKHGLTLALERLTPKDRFAIFRFSDRIGAFAEGLTQATPAAVERATAFIDGLAADGGTEIVQAMAAALAVGRADAGERLRQIVLITDGAVGNEEELFRLIDGGIGRARLFSVGIGTAPNGYLMTRAAQAGRGTFTFVQTAGEVAERMAELFLKLERPALTDVKLTWTDADKSARPEVWPRHLPDMYAGEPLVALIKLAAATPHLNVSGRIAGRLWEQTDTMQGGGGHTGAAALWGRQKIRDLMNDMRGRDEGPRAQVRGEAVKKALTFSLVSKYTSLIAVEREIARPAGAPMASAKVPLNLPKGSSREHIEGPAGPGASNGGGIHPTAEDPRKALAVSSGLFQPAMAFDRTDPALRTHLAAAVAGTPLLAMPRTATPAQGFMALGILFMMAAVALLIAGLREPDIDGGRGGPNRHAAGDD
ncbi:MAG: VWA domain-containing protein [Rhodospirillaceae bacterium]